MTVDQAIVWIDDKEARILRLEEGLSHKETLHALENLVPQAVEHSVEHTGADSTGGYFHRVARALDWADEILIVGPCLTKLQFLKYMHKNDHAIDPRILGVESVENPSGNELVGFASLYFTAGGPARSGNGAKRKIS